MTPPSVLVIRDASAADADACAEIYAPFVRDSAVSFEEEAPEPDVLRERIETVMRDYPWIVADRDGAVAGYAYATRHRERAAYRWAVEVTVYVAEPQRGRGIGTALYRELLGLLRAQGFRVALAGITLPNQPSVALHEACGFRHLGTYRSVGWKAGAWRDVGWWQAELQPAQDGPPPDPRPPMRIGRREV